MKLSALSAELPYIVYCDSGRRSSVAAFIMTQKGFNVQVKVIAPDMGIDWRLVQRERPNQALHYRKAIVRGRRALRLFVRGLSRIRRAAREIVVCDRFVADLVGSQCP